MIRIKFPTSWPDQNSLPGISDCVIWHRSRGHSNIFLKTLILAFEKTNIAASLNCTIFWGFSPHCAKSNTFRMRPFFGSDDFVLNLPEAIVQHHCHLENSWTASNTESNGQACSKYLFQAKGH